MPRNFSFLPLCGVFLLPINGWSQPLPEIDLDHVNPRFITDPVRHDSDDIKLWIHPSEPGQSLLFGTDKDRDGAIYAWNLRGEEQTHLTVRGIHRPNNLDILQNIPSPGGRRDILVATERFRHQLRAFSLPEMTPIDDGGIPVFTGASESPPMGIGLWQRPSDGAVFSIVSGKTGPSYGYLRQYLLEWVGEGRLSGREIRRFGAFSGHKEIEAIFVDREKGYVWYSDEGYGIRKYHADPDHPDAEHELALIDTSHFAGDVEGLSLYDTGGGRGYIMASDQQANRMHFFRREGTPGNPHHHPWLHSVAITAISSDGNTLSSRDLGPLFPTGLMAAMSEGKTFHLYHWDTLAGRKLTVAPDARPVVHWIWSGGITPRSARVRAKLGHREEIVLLVAHDDDYENALRVEACSWTETEDGWIASFLMDCLQPATGYHYVIERKGRAIWQHEGQFRTFPETASSLRVALGSCANTGSNHPVFSRIRELQPDFFLQLGDLHYEDIAVNDPRLFQEAFDKVLTAPRQAALYRAIPVAYVWDDHDYGPNNSDSSSPSRAAALSSYKTIVPHYELGDPDMDATYQAFSYGRVRFVLTDTRSHRSTRDIPDGPQRTMLGARQLEWLKEELLASSQSHAVIVWVNSVPWIGDTPHYDRWSGFSYERGKLAAFLEDNSIHNLVMVSGDAHMVAIDDGTNNKYGPSGRPLFPILQAGALDRTGSIKGGPYSHGAIPGPGQFGWLEIEDKGDTFVPITLQGRNHFGEVLLEHRFVLELPARPYPIPSANPTGL